MTSQPQPNAHLNRHHPRTILTHDPHDERHYGAVTHPIYQNSLFTFATQEDFEEASYDSSSFMYMRGNNPTVRQLEMRLAQLEHAEAARCFASGMAAISTALLSNLTAGDHVIAVDQAYAPARRFMAALLTRFGVTVTFVDGTSLPAIRQAVRPETKVLYLESPTSLRMQLQDLRACAELAKSIGAVTIIDNTWATPLYQNPIRFGIDLVVHSVSKYIGGHSDVVGGVVLGSAEQIEKLNQMEYLLLGGIMQPHAAALAMRGLRTLHLRLEQAHASGLAVARRLEQAPYVAQVNHPGLESHPQHGLYLQQMSGSGSLFSAELRMTLEQARAFVNRLELFRIGVSWGGYESLVYLVLPELAASATPEQTSLIRFYVGLEEPADLLRDIETAAEAVLRGE